MPAPASKIVLQCDFDGTIATEDVSFLLLDAFVGGYGQRFDVKRQVVQTIEVKAKAFSGAPVDVMFGDGPRR